MTEIVLKILDNWHYLVILLFAHSAVKLSVQSYLKIIEIRAMNKSVVRVEESADRRAIEIRTDEANLEKFYQIKKGLESSDKAS